MDVLTVDAFVQRLSPFAGKEILTPAEASQLSLTVAESVLDHSIDLRLLKFLCRFWTPASYDEAVEERNIEHQCGYPVCIKAPMHKVRRPSQSGAPTMATKYQIYNRKPSLILPNTYLSQYCCKEHYQASVFYRNQLSTEAVFARKNITVVPPFAEVPGRWYENCITCLEEVLATHRQLKPQGKSLSDVIAMMNGLSVADGDAETSELVQLIEDFEIVEKEGGLGDSLDADDRVESSKTVEGYVTTDRSFGGYMV